MGVHASRQCVAALAGILSSAVTGVEGRVFVGRVTPLAAVELPALMVDIVSEEISLGTVHSPPDLMRSLTIEVSVIVREQDEYDQEAYALLVEVEHAIAADSTLGGVALDAAPTSIEFTRVGEADRPVVRATLQVRAEVHTMSNAVDVPL